MAKLLLWCALVAVGCNNNTASERPAPTEPAAKPTPIQQKSAKAKPWPKGKALKLLTYNVLATPLYKKQRTKALLEILDKSDADIIALQEVAPWFLRAILSAPWFAKKGYFVSQDNGRPFAPGGQFFMAKIPLATVSVMVMPGKQQRILLIAEFRIGERTMAVATTHMESFLEDGAVRAQQLAGIFRFISKADDAMLMGDLNFGDGEEPETSRLDKAYVDLWPALHPDKPGFTWHIVDNPIARIGAFVGEPSRRLDRILLRSKAWKPTSIAIIGNATTGKRTMTLADRAMIEMEGRPPGQPEDIDVFPSDHYGLSAIIAPSPIP